MKKTILLSIFGILFYFTGITQNTHDFSKLLDRYKQEVSDATERGNVKAISFALIDGNRIVCSENYGYSDFENQIKADSNTIYGVGSVSKVYTASAVLQLHEKGIINLDSSITKYIPDFKIKSRDNAPVFITPRMLINHYSGLPADITHAEFSKNPKHFSSVIKMLEKEYMQYPPNSCYSYSNIGYSLLGVIIENMTSYIYEDYIKEFVFKPLDLQSGCFTSDHSSKFAKGYDEKGILRNEYGIRSVPAGEIKSNITDLAKFAMTFLPDYTGSKILDSSTISTMFVEQNQNLPLNLGEKHGFPWFFEKVNSAGQIYMHSGGTMNHRSLIILAPESNLAVVIISNSVNIGYFQNRSIKLLDSCALAKGRPVYKKNHKTVYELDKIRLNEGELKTFEGLYANPDFVFELISTGTQLRTHIDGHKYLLTPLKDGSFLPDICISDSTTSTLTNMRVEFSNISNNELVIFHNLRNGSKQILGTKFQVGKLNSTWKNRLGVYEIVDSNLSDYQFLTYFELLVENGVLIFRQMEEYEGTEKYNTAFSIYDDNTALSIGIGRHRGSTILFEVENKMEILWFSGYKLQLVGK